MKGKYHMEKLTKRELEVAELVTLGLSNRVIANQLYISHHTVKATLEKVYEKLNITNRVLLAVYMTKLNYNISLEQNL